MKRTTKDMQVCDQADRLGEIEIPLKNIEYTIQEYLMAHGTRLDTDTRVLLAGVRDCVGRVAASARLEPAPVAPSPDMPGRIDSYRVF